MGAIFGAKIFRELVLAAIIIILLAAYYFRYIRIARLRDNRQHRHWLDELLFRTRILFTILVVALVGLIVFDRVLEPHFASTNAARSSLVSKAPAKHKKAARRAASSSSQTLTDVQAAAVDLVKNYYAQNPAADGAAVSFRYKKETVGNGQVTVQEIAGYSKSGKLKHLYLVYPSQQFDIKK